MWSAEALWERLCLKRGLVWGLILYPLSLVYGLLSQWLRRGRPQEIAGLRVISVGNISMGGAGKSPLVATLARYFRRQKIAVLTRGYGGDEARMLEKALPWVSVIVDSNRWRAAEAARSQGCQVALMDDGFQRRHQLARDLDILVLDWQRREVESYCLPAGRLREPLKLAADADAVVVTHAPSDWNAEALRLGLAQPYQGLRIFRGDHVPVALHNLQGKKKPLSWLKGRPVIAVSGIGRPDAFEESLRELGALLELRRFKDHHRYRVSDLPKEGVVVTTAKDAVKLEGLPLTGLEILVLEIQMRVSPEKEFEAMILR